MCLVYTQASQAPRQVYHCLSSSAPVCLMETSLPFHLNLPKRYIFHFALHGCKSSMKQLLLRLHTLSALKYSLAPISSIISWSLFLSLPRFVSACRSNFYFIQFMQIFSSIKYPFAFCKWLLKLCLVLCMRLLHSYCHVNFVVKQMVFKCLTIYGRKNYVCIEIYCKFSIEEKK